MSAQVSSQQLFENIAMDNGLLTKVQLNKAKKELKKRQSSGQDEDLGEVLVDMGFLTRNQVGSIARAKKYRETRNRDKRLARQCVKMRLCKPDEVQDLLTKQKAAYTKDGSTLGLPKLLASELAVADDDVQRALDALAEVQESKRIKKLSNEGERAHVRCPHCEAKLLIRKRNFGKTVRCSSCGAHFKTQRPEDEDQGGDDLDVPIVADLDDGEDDDEVIDLADIQLDEAEERVLEKRASDPLLDLPEVDNDLGDLDEIGEVQLDSADTNADDGADDELDDLDGIDADLNDDGLDDLDDTMLRSDDLDDFDDVDIDDIDEAALKSEPDEFEEENALGSDILKSDSHDIEFDDLDDLDAIEESDIEDIDDAEISEVDDDDFDDDDFPSSTVGTKSDELKTVPQLDGTKALLGGSDSQQESGEDNPRLVDSGVYDVDWATAAFDDRPISTAKDEPSGPKKKPKQAKAPAPAPAVAEELPEPVFEDDLINAHQETQKLNADDFQAISAPSASSLSFDRQALNGIEKELSSIGELGTLLDEIEDPELSEIANKSTSHSVPKQLRRVLICPVNELENLEVIDELLPDDKLFTMGQEISEERLQAALPKPIKRPSAPTPSGRISRVATKSAPQRAASQAVASESFGAMVAATVTAQAESELPQSSEAEVRRAFEKAIEVAWQVFRKELGL